MYTQNFERKIQKQVLVCPSIFYLISQQFWCLLSKICVSKFINFNDQSHNKGLPKSVKKSFLWSETMIHVQAWSVLLLMYVLCQTFSFFSSHFHICFLFSLVLYAFYPHNFSQSIIFYKSIPQVSPSSLQISWST